MLNKIKAIKHKSRKPLAQLKKNSFYLCFIIVGVVTNFNKVKLWLV